AGSGTWGVVMRTIGPSRSSKHSSATIEAISAPHPHRRGFSSTVNRRPVLLTSPRIVRVSSGTRHRTSTTIALIPMPSSSAAAAIARGTIAARATIVQSLPLRRTLAVGHVTSFGDLVGDHVPASREEVGKHDLDDRPQPCHCCAHRRPDNRLLRDRSIPHTLSAKPIEQADSCFEDAAGGSDILADEVHGGVALHLLRDACGHRLAKRQFRHDERPSLQTWLSMSSIRAGGALRASSVATSTLRRDASSIFVSVPSS